LRKTLTSVGSSIISALVLGGCLHQIRPLSETTRLSDPQTFLELVRTRSARLHSVRASGYADIRSSGRHLRAHVTLAAQRPAWLRFETESFFDQPLSILTTDGMVFALWDMDKGRFLTGKATPANISRVIPLLLDGAEVAGIVLGDPPLIPYATLELFFDDVAQLYRLVLRNSRQEQEVRIEPTSLRPVQVICHNEGKLWYQLFFEDWSGNPNGPRAPQTLRFASPHDSIKIEIHLRQADINPQLDEGLFRLTPPGGMRLEPVD
jgi:hypothetical protein